MNDIYKITIQDLHDLVNGEVIHLGIYMVCRKECSYQSNGKKKKRYSPDTYEIINPHLKQIAEGSDTHIVSTMNKLNEHVSGEFYEPKKYGIINESTCKLLFRN